MFTKSLILWYFDLKCYMRIEINVLGYIIRGVLSQLTSDHLISNQDYWHPIAYFLRKMILAEIKYKTYDGKLLAIIKIFKTWRHYLEGCKYKVLILIDYNNLYQFINIKSPSFCQVRWFQKLFQYHFQIDYCQEKANGAANVLSHFSQRNQAGKDDLQTENTQILHKLQSLLTNASLSDISTLAKLSLLHWVLIYGIYILPQLW